MTEARIGRLLPACLHQAIFDVIPQRVDFYEEWLDSDGLRDGNIGLAPITAVVGFLRTEGPSYDGVMTRAGQLAAEWTLASRPSLRYRVVRRLPRSFRLRAALKMAGRIAGDVLSTSSATARVRRGRAHLDVSASLFCGVRERQAAPLCAFYRAVVIETLRAFDVAADVSIEHCRALGAPSCVIGVQPTSGIATSHAAAA